MNTTDWEAIKIAKSYYDGTETDRLYSLDLKSALDCPKGYRYAYANSASQQFAPMLVPLLRNCLDNTFPTSMN